MRLLVCYDVIIVCASCDYYMRIVLLLYD